MVMPIQMNASGTQLLATSGASPLNGWTLFPAIPNPIADFDSNAVVNGADMSAFLASWTIGNLSADVDHDGILSTADYDAFTARWNYMPPSVTPDWRMSRRMCSRESSRQQR